MGVVYLVAGLVTTLSLASYNALDPSLNTANPARPQNLIGYPGSYFADLCYHILGIGSFVAPALFFLLGVKWLRSKPVEAPWIRMIGSAVLLLGTCTALSLGPEWRPFGGVILAGGLTGMLLADFLVESLNLTGGVLVTATAIFLSLYLISSFSMAKLYGWFAGPIGWWRSLIARLSERWQAFQARREQKREEREQRRQKEAAWREVQAEMKAAANGPEIVEAPRMSRRTPLLSRRTAIAR